MIDDVNGGFFMKQDKENLKAEPVGSFSPQKDLHHPAGANARC